MHQLSILLAVYVWVCVIKSTLEIRVCNIAHPLRNLIFLKRHSMLHVGMAVVFIFACNGDGFVAAQRGT